MCLAIPGKVINTDGKNATIELMGVMREVSVELLKDVQIGDYLLVHAGCAIQKIDEEEALETIKIFEEIGKL